MRQDLNYRICCLNLIIFRIFGNHPHPHYYRLRAYHQALALSSVSPLTLPALKIVTGHEMTFNLLNLPFMISKGQCFRSFIWNFT